MASGAGMASSDQDPGWDLVFQDVQVTIGETQALKSASGAARAGRLLALMGPSGAGKTTLLNALARKGPVTEGSISYGGRGWSKALKRRVAYVEQDDIVYPDLTVRQSVTFLARLRLAGNTDPGALEERVNATLALLKLDKCADSRVGGAAARGISGGERKRLCIAQELLVDPKIMMLDEPTSGLDSSMAHVVADLLRDLTRTRNLTVIASIHQPSSQVFFAFDDLIMLDQGRVCYRGPTRGVDSYFSDRLGLPTPTGYNPSDYMMEIAVEGKLAEPAALDKLREDFGPGTVPEDYAAEGTLTEKAATRYTQSWTTQFRILAERDWLLIRPKLWSWQTFILYVGQAVISGILWFQLGFREEDIFSRLTATFSIGIPWLFFPLLDALPLFPTSMVNLRKELGVGAYQVSAWFWAKTTLALTNYIIWPWFHVTIFYGLSDLNSDPAVYFTLFAIILLSIITYQSLGLLIAASFPPDKMMTVTLLLVTFFFLFTGIFIPLEDSALPWLGYINPVLFTLFAQVRAVFDGQTYTCNDDGTGFPDACTAAGSDGKIRAEDVYDEFDIFFTAAESVGVLIGFGLFFRFAAYFIFRRSLEDVINPKEHVDAHTHAEGDAPWKGKGPDPSVSEERKGDEPGSPRRVSVEEATLEDDRV